MSFLAAKSAALPHLTPRPLRALTSGLKTGNRSGEVPSFCGLLAAPLELRFWANFFSQGTDDDFGPAWVSRFVSRPLLGHYFGAKPAPCGSASFCFACSAPSGSRFLPEQVCKRAAKAPHKLLPGPAKKALLGTWEPGPLARLCHV